MNKLSIDQVELKGKRVFIRVDFNVPIENGEVTDTTRIEKTLPTIRYAVNAGARVIVASHLGRPKGKPCAEYSLEPVAPVFSQLLGRPVEFAGDCVGHDVERKVARMKAGDVLLLENLRFHSEERENEEEFAKSLAVLADVYVNDAFGAAHRAHASTEGITRFLKPAVAGFLLKDEIAYFNRSMAKPHRPLAAILGGAKVSTKIGAFENLVDTCDIILVGGGMAFTFLKAMGYETGNNIVENDMLDEANEVMQKAKDKGVKFYLPVDFVVADSIDEHCATQLAPYQEIPAGKVAPDIGPASIELFRLALKPARTIVWNGPVGVFEKKPFAKGTMAMIDVLAGSDALTVVGGGDSVKAVNMAGKADKIDFMSTGGGAFLMLMEGKTLPGLSALTDGAS